MFSKLVGEPFKRYVTSPLRQHVINPLRNALGLETDPVRDTALDALTQQAVDSLKIETLPGSNVISIDYSFNDPKQGTAFVAALLQNYLVSRQALQSIDLPQSFYETKKHLYQVRLDGLEGNRQALLKVSARPIRKRKSPSASTRSTPKSKRSACIRIVCCKASAGSNT